MPFRFHAAHREGVGSAATFPSQTHSTSPSTRAQTLNTGRSWRRTTALEAPASRRSRKAARDRRRCGSRRACGASWSTSAYIPMPPRRFLRNRPVIPPPPTIGADAAQVGLVLAPGLLFNGAVRKLLGLGVWFHVVKFLEQGNQPPPSTEPLSACSYSLIGSHLIGSSPETGAVQYEAPAGGIGFSDRRLPG